MSMRERLGSTLERLWSTGRGRLAVILTGLLLVGLIAGIAVLSIPKAQQNDNALVVPTTDASQDPASAGEDLFELLPPSSPVAPPVAENGQTDIGGPGMVANGPEAGFGQGPIAKPNPVTGLMPIPARVPAAELVVPISDRFATAQECASPRVPQARAIANQMLAYLFTWDSSKANWSDFAVPMHELWAETGLSTRGGTAMKVDPGSNWEDRMATFGLSERQWEAWTKTGVSSQVEVNQVVTLAGPTQAGVLPYAVRVQYLVTVTRTAPGVQPQSKQETVWVDIYAPCPAEVGRGLPVWGTPLVSLQAADWAVIPEDRLE